MNFNNDFCERLKELEILLGKNPDEMSSALNCSASSYYRYRNGTTTPDLNTICKLLDLNPHINMNWLIQGRGQAVSSGNSSGIMENDHDGKNTRFYHLPMYHMKTGRKDGEGRIRRMDWNRPTEYFPICLNFIENMLPADNHEGLFVITVECKSMTPVIQPGSVVIADERLNDISNDGIFVVGFDDVIRLKLVQKLPGRKLQLSSINEDFKPIIVSEKNDQDIRILGKIIWVGTPL